jgi:hypothetical protein
VAKRRKVGPRRREQEITEALITVHADPAVRGRDRRLFRAAHRRLARQADTFMTRQNACK